MADLLKNKIALVTGGGRGIGRAEALALAAQGAKVVVNDLGAEPDGSGATTRPADEVVNEIRKLGGVAEANYDSVATPEGAENIIKTALDNFGGIDILVNNAGNTRAAMAFDMALEDWDSVIKVHLYGTFYCTRYALPHMRQQGYGRIINTSSHYGLGQANHSNYAAAKEGIVGFSRSVARELGEYGITCNVIRPSAHSTMSVTEAAKEHFVRIMGEKEGLEFFDRRGKVVPPEGVAALVAYLASEHADNVNGCVFEVWKGHIGIYRDPPEVAQVLWKDGHWLPEELVKTMPRTLTRDKVRDLPPSAVAFK